MDLGDRAQSKALLSELFPFVMPGMFVLSQIPALKFNLQYERLYRWGPMGVDSVVRAESHELN